jgi:hypothetical protein
MKTKPILKKDDKIKREISRLRKVFKELDKNKQVTVESLVKTAAFMAVSIEELEEIINNDGYTEEYQNGKNQKGIKQTEAVKTHLAMIKNFTLIIRHLSDLTPPAKKKGSRLEALSRE